MASWSLKRQWVYFLAFIAFLLLVLALPVFLVFYEAPSCSDGKQNGGEKGVDCGGSCTRLCPADFGEPHILWSYSMNVAPGIYNSLAYIENPNQSVEARAADYSFKFFDDKGLLVVEKKGRTFIPAGQKFAVFAGGIRTGERVPARTTFEFRDDIEWKRGERLADVGVLSIDLEQGETPKAEVKIVNKSIDRVLPELSVFIIVYDQKDNRLAFSKTVADSLKPGETAALFFTWPETFVREAIRSEVIFVPRSAR